MKDHTPWAILFNIKLTTMLLQAVFIQVDHAVLSVKPTELPVRLLSPLKLKDAHLTNMCLFTCITNPNTMYL